MKNVSFSLSNYGKPTPAKLKAFADALLVSLLVIDPMMETMPEFAHKEWVLWAWKVFVVLFKLATNGFTVKEEVK